MLPFLLEINSSPDQNYNIFILHKLNSRLYNDVFGVILVRIFRIFGLNADQNNSE